MKTLTKEDRRDWAVKHGALPMERGTQEIVWNMDQVQLDHHSGKFSHRIGWTLMVAAVKIIELKTGTLFRSVEEMQKAYDLICAFDPQSGDFWCPSIRFTPADFNRILRKNYTVKQIEAFVTELPSFVFRMTKHSSMMVLDENGVPRFPKYTSEYYDNIAGVEVTKTGTMKPGGGAGEENVAFVLYFKSKFGLAFWQTLAAGGFSLLTNKNEAVRRFLRLPGSGQMLVWAIWSWKDKDSPVAIRSEAQMFAILGWKKAKEQSNYLGQKRRLTALLNRLVKEGFLIEHWIDENGAYRLRKVPEAPLLS